MIYNIKNFARPVSRFFLFSVLVLALLAAADKSFSQTLESYLRTRGVAGLSETAHPSNDFQNGSYAIDNNSVYVTINSKDNVFGIPVTTRLRLTKGSDLFFCNIKVLEDTDFVKPFGALGLQVAFIQNLIQAVDAATYNEMRYTVRKYFNTDFENWTGEMWAVLALNLDYYEYLLTGN